MNKNQSPNVSVILPVYNGERYVAEAIESILAQDYKDYELIVINDGSYDRTLDILRQYQQSLAVFNQPNSGLPAALNLGLKVSGGRWITFLDADDLWVEDKLTLQNKMVSENPDLDIVFGHVRQFVSDEIKGHDRKKIQIPPDPLPGISKITMFAIRSVFDTVGFFNEDLSIGEFIEWYTRAKEANLNMYVMREVVAKRRVHKWHTTGQDPESRTGYARILKASLDRRRAAENKIKT